MKIKNKVDLRWTYLLLQYVKKLYKERHTDDLKTKMDQLKVAIRNYNKLPIDSIIVRDNGIDGYVKLVYIPRYFDDLDKNEVKKYFEENYVLSRHNSMHDCTGQAFTSWFKVFRRGGHWVVYHSISFDV